MYVWLEIGLPLAIAAYYVTVVLLVRKPSPQRTTMVQYEPPDRLSPAAIRYVWRGCVDQRTVACVFAQLALKGFLQITPGNGKYRLRKLKAADPSLAMEERLTMDWLFSNFLEEKVFHPMTDSQGCISSLTGSIAKQLSGKYQSTHYGFAFLGFVMSLAGAFLLASQSKSDDRAGVYLLTYMIFVGVVLATIIFMVLFEAGRDLLRGLGTFSRVVFGILVTLFVAVPMGIVARDLAVMVSSGMAVGVAAMAATNVVGTRFLKTATERGLEVRQEVEGFREFLLAVDQDRLDRLAGAPHVSKEANLGYAIALEVKEAWGDDLANACYPQFLGQ